MIHIVTVATEKNVGYLPNLEKGCKQFNYPFHILGLGEKWTGLTMKFRLCREFLETQKDDDIIIFVDGYDVLFFNDEELMEKFKSINSDIVFSRDYTSDNFFVRYYVQKIFLFYINTGCYMGYVSALKKMFDMLEQKIKMEDSMDDQRILNMLYLDNSEFREMVSIDENHKIFESPQINSYQKAYADHRMNHNANFYHGHYNTNMDYILDKFDLKTDIETDKRDEYILLKLPHYIKFFIPELIVFTLIIGIILYFLVKFIIKKMRGKKKSKKSKIDLEQDVKLIDVV